MTTVKATVKAKAAKVNCGRPKRAELLRIVHHIHAEPQLAKITTGRPTCEHLRLAIMKKRNSMTKRKFALVLGPALAATAIGVTLLSRQKISLDKQGKYVDKAMTGVENAAKLAGKVVDAVKKQPNPNKVDLSRSVIHDENRPPPPWKQGPPKIDPAAVIRFNNRVSPAKRGGWKSGKRAAIKAKKRLNENSI